MSAPRFGQTPRPGGDPPPRQPLTAEQIHIRETFDRQEHLKQNPVPEPAPAPGAKPVVTVDLEEIRKNLRQEGMDLQIFPIGEKPLDLGGRNQYREKRIAELEAERPGLLERCRIAESAAAGAIKELKDLTVSFDTLTGEMEALKSAATAKET